MAGRRFLLSDYLDARCAELAPLFAFSATSIGEARQWRSRALAKARDLLGEMPESVQLKAETVTISQDDRFRLDHVVFDADRHSSVPCLMLTPENRPAPCPAVICVHGLRSRKEDMIELLGWALAQSGYVVLAFDLRCFGERAEADGASGEQRDLLCARGSLLGVNILALHVHDALRAVDYLCERADVVDPRRIACVGTDLGGTVTMWASAIEKRIRAAAITGCLADFSATRSEADTYTLRCLPSLRRYFGTSDLAALIAPRPLLIQRAEPGERDSEVCVLKRLKAAYQACGAAEAVSATMARGSLLHAPSIAEWLNRWL